MPDPAQLSKRERQIMDVIWEKGEATVAQVAGGIPAPPTRTAVRTLLGILENKGFVAHRKQGREFVFRPARSKSVASRSALRRLLQTFFGGSLEQAVAVRLSDRTTPLSADELERISKLIEQARQKARPS